MSYNHHQQYGHQGPIYGEYADNDEPAVSEPRPGLFPVPHPLFTREEITNTRTLDPYPSTQSPQSWSTYEQSFHHHPLSYPPYPVSSSFPPQRLSPPPPSVHQTFNFKAPGQSVNPGSALTHRLTLAGSLDPATGIFYRTPEHPRLRTAQACEKCRRRKAKCSGEHPSCKRCVTRGLICEYAKEGRVRGPNKSKSKNGATSTASPCVSASSASTGASSMETSNNSDTTIAPKSAFEQQRGAAKQHHHQHHRPPSSHSSEGSSDQTPNETTAGQSLFLPPSSVGIRSSESALHGDYPYHESSLSSTGSPPLSPLSVSRGRRSALDSGPSTSSPSRQNSGEHQSSSQHQHQIMDVHLDTASSLFRLSGASAMGEGTGSHSMGLSLSSKGDIRSPGDMGPGIGVNRLSRSLADESHLYPFQHPEVQQRQRAVQEQGFMSDIVPGIAGQSHRYQQSNQSYQPFHSQRGDIFSTLQTQPTQNQHHDSSLQTTMEGDDLPHSLSPVGRMMQPRRVIPLLADDIPSAYVMAQSRITAQSAGQSHFSSQHQQQQQPQHNLVPVNMGMSLSGEDHHHHTAGRRHEFGPGDHLGYPQHHHPLAVAVHPQAFFQTHEHYSRTGHLRPPMEQAAIESSSSSMREQHQQQHQHQRVYVPSYRVQEELHVPHHIVPSQHDHSRLGAEYQDRTRETLAYDAISYTSPRTASATTASGSGTLSAESNVASPLVQTPVSASTSVGGGMDVYGHYTHGQGIQVDPALGTESVQGPSGGSGSGLLGGSSGGGGMHASTSTSSSNASVVSSDLHSPVHGQEPTSGPAAAQGAAGAGAGEDVDHLGDVNNTASTNTLS